MAKVLRSVAVLAGVVALTFAIPGVGTALAGALGAAGSAATISAIASAVSVTPAAPEQLLSKGAGP
jgi:hypothetical protein